LALFVDTALHLPDTGAFSKTKGAAHKTKGPDVLTLTSGPETMY
jgi:hypothetical protein